MRRFTYSYVLLKMQLIPLLTMYCWEEQEE